MSCTNNVQRCTIAAVKGGISRNANKAAFFAGTCLGVIALLAARPFRFWRQRKQSKPGKIRPLPPRSSSSLLPVLRGIEQVKPIPANQLTGQCAQCGNSVRESPNGAWYRLNKGQYCPHCAPDRAKAENIVLLPATTEAASGDRPLRYTPRLTTLQAKSVSVGAVENIQGYSVRCLGRDTGLSLVPEVTMREGQAKVNSSRWFIIYERAGEPIGGPFANVKQAQTMASLLANFDWTRAPGQFTPAEVQQAAAMARQQRGDLGFYRDKEEEKQLEGLWRGGSKQ